MLRLVPLALLLAAAGAAAQQPPNNPPGQSQEHRGPPQEAFDACKGKKDGDTAQMKTPRGDTMAGTCRMVLVPTRSAVERTPPPQQQQQQRERPPVK